jgi:hypothetical protein
MDAHPRTLTMQDETAWLGRLLLGSDADGPLGPMLAGLCTLLTPRLSGPDDVADIALTELAAAGLDNPLGLQLLLSLLPEGLAQLAARDARGCCHVGDDAIERLAGHGEGLCPCYRFDLAGMRALPFSNGAETRRRSSHPSAGRAPGRP